ncbi:hypothetical protein H9P43_009865 [Blastocladiella emersonii ATCC 22665]|nr:hypothetical protein H9P43_009865 [Blastocladiella emersonii ATCC 22665]
MVAKSKTTGDVEDQLVGHDSVKTGNLVVGDAKRDEPKLALYVEAKQFMDRSAQVVRADTVPESFVQNFPEEFLYAAGSGSVRGTVRDNPVNAKNENPDDFPTYQDTTHTGGNDRAAVLTTSGAVIVGKGNSSAMYFFLGHPRDGGELVGTAKSTRRFDLAKHIDVAVAPGVGAAAILTIVGAIRRMMFTGLTA